MKYQMQMSDVLRVGIALLSILGAAAPATVVAQDSTCTYDRCALAFHRSFWSRHLVRGDSGLRVARIGFSAPTLAEFANRQDSVGIYIRQFRARHTSGNWIAVLGVLTATAGQLVVYQSRADGVGSGIVLLGLGMVWVGGDRVRRGENALQRAIWLYNRTLVR